LMPSASATEEPPYFCTTMPTVLLEIWSVPTRPILAAQVYGADRPPYHKTEA